MERAPTRVLLVRHGRVHNPGRILYGRLPRFGLSPEGRRQARQVGEGLAAASLAAVYASPLLRARQTAAEVLRFHPELRLRISRLLHEVLTPFEGLPLAEARAAGEDFYTGAGPGFEQPPCVAERMLRFLGRAARVHPSGVVVAVTHGDPLAFLVLRLAGADPDPRRKAALHRYGVTDGYPQPGSVLAVDAWPDGSARMVGYGPAGGDYGKATARWNASASS